MARMHVRPSVPEVERKRPDAASQPPARGARGSTATLLRLQRTAGNRAVGALLAGRQPRVLARCGSGRCRCGGACRTNGLADEEDRHLGRAGSARLQRSVGEWFDTIGETISEGVETVEHAVESATTKLGTLADLASFPPCPEELGAALPVPGLVDWLDNEGLEAVRNEGEVLSRTKKPSVGDHGATLLLKQVLHAWGCEKLGRDLLPKHGSEGPFGPETQEAVKQFQLWSWLTVDGAVGPQTLAALDKHMGVRPASRAPAVVGGSKEQGKSNWSVSRVPAAHIYFRTDESSLDADDERILEAMAAEISSPRRGTKDITLEVVGYADKREDVWHNVFLSEGRAETVSDYLVELLEDSVNVTVTTKPKGEIERPQVGETEEELKPFRRVDVYVVEEVFRERPPDATCLEPTTAWVARLRNMQGLGVGSFGMVDIEMAHPDSTGTRWRMTYKFGSLGWEFSLDLPGVPTPSVSGDSNAVPFFTSVPLAITEFSGSAEYIGASAAAGGTGYGIETLTIKGIEDHGAREVDILFEGPGTGATAGISGSIYGRLSHLKPCEEITSP
jgi:outer membrane protein OmpA-like peptidoglycan-associated protein